MRRLLLAGVGVFLGSVSCAGLAAGPPAPEGKPDGPEAHKFEPFKPESVPSNGTVTVAGHPIAYQAIAGTLIVHPNWDDVPGEPEKPAPASEEGANPTAEASMFYVAYFKSGESKSALGLRPITFIYKTADRVRLRSGCTWVRSAHVTS